MVDATIVRVHRHGQGAKGTQSQAIGRSSGGMTTVAGEELGGVRDVVERAHALDRVELAVELAQRRPHLVGGDARALGRARQDRVDGDAARADLLGEDLDDEPRRQPTAGRLSVHRDPSVA